MKPHASEELTEAQRAYAAFLRARLDFWRAQPLAGNYCFEIARREARQAHPLVGAERAGAERYVAGSIVLIPPEVAIDDLHPGESSPGVGCDGRTD